MTGVQLSHLCSILPICYIFVIISMGTFPCSCSAEEKIFVTMVTHRPQFTGSEQPVYYCYVNSPDLDVTVSTGRVVPTREDAFFQLRNPEPPDPEQITSASYPSGATVYRINIDFESDYEFGTYACDASWEDGVTEYTTSVSNIIMLSNGDIYPASSLVTQTVNVGDRNVNIGMYLDNTVDENDLEWRHNTRIIRRAGSSSGTYSFSRGIQKSDEGVYICYESYRWSSAFHGMQRLIVRGCQASRWGPPLCNCICDNCYHGGVCDDETGRCICPPGFMGPNCLRACGGNRFGYNCEFTCGTLDSDYNCVQRQFCLLDPYGCSCSTGISGLNCNSACAQGTFGANCLQECHCRQNCNTFTGECQGTCEQGWAGQSCQIPDICPNDYYGSDCVEKCRCKDDAPCNKETGECPNQECHPGYTVYPGSVSCQECQEGYFGDLCQEECHCEASACDKVTGECSGQCKPQWATTDCQTGLISSEAAKVNPNTESQVNCTAAGTSKSLNLFRPFLSRSQDVQDVTNIQTLSASSTDVDGSERRTTSFLVSDVPNEEQLFCLLTSQSGRIISASLPVTVYVYDLPELTNLPEQVNVTSSEVTISWIAWDSERDVGDPPVLSYVPYYKMSLSDEWSSGATVDSEETLEFRVADLEADTSYMFAVAAVREGSGGEGPRGPSLMVKTLCDVEPSTPVEVTASLTTKNQVRVTWRVNTEEIMCSTGISNFSVYYVTEGSSKEQKFVTMVTADLMETMIESSDLGSGSHTFYVTFTTDVESTLNIQGDKSSNDTVYLKPEVLSSSDTSSVAVYLIPLIIISVLLIVVMVFSIVRYRTKNSSNGKKTEKEDDGEDAGAEYVNAAVNPEDYIPLERQPKTVLSSEYEDLHHKSEGGVSMPFLYERNIVPEPQKPVTTPTIQTRNSKGINSDVYEDVGVSSKNRRLPDVPQSGQSVGDNDEDNTYEVPDSLEEYTGVYVNIKSKKKLLRPGPIKVAEFQKFMSRNKEDVVKDIVHQFMALPSGKQYPWKVALEFKNKPRNLFKTVLPYDHSRVKLDTAGSDARSDYINASYIKNHQGKTSFIAAQGPHQSTVDDFWMMVWQEHVETIVMVTDTVEGNKPLCSTYWPSKVHMGEVCGDITVILMQYTSYSTHTIRKLNLLKGNHNPEVHTVYQLQVHSWPYGGVPKEVPSLISIIKKVKTWQTDGRSSTLLVHCSNGIGATGTFIAAYVLMDVIKENKDVNIFDFVKRMRDDRVDMVQTRIQYLIIFEFLLAVLQSIDSEMSCDRLKKLGHTGIKLKSEKEFKVLQESNVEKRYCENYVGHSLENQHKNRFNHMIPGDKVRPVLKSQGNTIGSSSYINAFHLAGFVGTEFIMTQTPLASTVEDFWRLVYDYDCRTIVMLNDVGGSDETVVQYWPSGGSVQYGLMEVDCTSKLKGDSCIQSQFQVTHKMVGEKSVSVDHFAFCGWSGNQPDVSKLMQFIRYIGNSGHGPVLVHCINGVGLSAVYVIAKTESERLEQEGFVDVFQSVKKLREKCPLALQKQEEYTLCYQLLKNHLDSPDEYTVVR